MSSTSIQNQLKNLPHSSGVYFFRDQKGKILYIGKAINLRRRVASYFQRQTLDLRLSGMVEKIAKIDYQKTDSVIEALFLEANLVKKFQPFYNVKLKDDKTFVNIAVSDEEFPRIFVMRPTVKRLYKKIKIARLFGPYPSAKTARTALKILRRIFPFRGLEKTREAQQFYKEIIEIPENKKRYNQIIKNVILFLQGKKKRLLGNLKKQMKKLAEMSQFEQAAKIRNQIFALRHIQDVALLKEEVEELEKPVKFIPHRIEAYDISNIFGSFATGSMVVFTDGKIDTEDYRHFKIKGIKGISDTAMLQEVLSRRFKHTEWKFPDLIIIDGGKGQLNAAKKVLKNYGLDIPIIAIAKGPKRKGAKLFKTKNAPLLDLKLIKHLRDEAHRFAISYHRKLKRKGILE